VQAFREFLREHGKEHMVLAADGTFLKQELLDSETARVETQVRWFASLRDS
jgi:hypothetical protein